MNAQNRNVDLLHENITIYKILQDELAQKNKIISMFDTLSAARNDPTTSDLHHREQQKVP